MSMGHPPGMASHTPDLKKDEADVTHAERQEAKRRIGGSLAPERDGGFMEGLKPQNLQ